MVTLKIVRKRPEKKVVLLRPKERILKYLIENKGPKPIMQISGATFMDYKNTYNLIKELEKKGLIIKEVIGNTNPVRVSLKPNYDIYLTENKRTEEFLNKYSKLRVVKKYIQELNYPFMIVLVFGSYVKGNANDSSDIDVCVICDSLEVKKELNNKLNLLSLKIELHDFSSEEFVSMIKKKENNVGNEILKSNVILYGIENYYNLISKWMKKE